MSDVDYDCAIAIVGMAGRFPGADSVDELWSNLLAGRGGLRELSDEELLAAGVSPAQLADPSYVRVNGSVNDHDRFDAGMFGFGRREAETMDPQHRVFLETCYEAIENAGYPPMQLRERVGLFAGCGFPDYLWNVLGAFEEAGGALMLAIGTERDSFTSIASYKMNLRGPSVSIQTFCSTSLVAVHLASQALLNFECEIALAGGAFLTLPHGTGYAFEEGGIYAPDGKVRAFDAGARGSVAGNAVSVVVLKRLGDAIADGDHITAVVLGSATNNDGSACAGYTAPGVDGQAAVIADAISFAGVKPESIGYIECHGTGTVLGDSIELAAMARNFRARPDRKVVLGSLKASIGHTDRAAGTSSLIRAALAVRHGVLPATPNYRTPNPALLTARDKFEVLTADRPWLADRGPRRAGVSAFGLGGTNAHVVLEEPPEPPPATDRPGPHLLVLSARDAAALDAATERLRAHLLRQPGLVLADVAFTQQVSRSTFPVRRAVVCDGLADATAALADPGRWIDGTTRQRTSVVELVLAPQADERWCAAVIAAARALGAAVAQQPATPAGAVLAVAEALGGLGVRVGGVCGPESVRDLAAGLAAQLGAGTDAGVCDTARARLVVGPDGAAAEHWFARSVARLWQDGVEVEWSGLHPGRPRRVPLPTYPFQRRRYWVDGMVAQSSASPSAAGRTDDLDQWTYAPTWRSVPVELGDRSEQMREAGPWLVLAGDRRGEAVAAYLRGCGAAVTVARLGDGYTAAEDGQCTIRPDSTEDLARLLAALEQVPRTVVHAFSLAPADAGAEPGLGRSRARGYHTALALAAVYSKVAPDLGVNLLGVTEGALAIAGTAPTHPEQAVLAGLLPVLAQENPGWICRHVDIDAPAHGGDAALAAAIAGAALGQYQGPIALRGTGRWVRTFEHLPLPAPQGPGGVPAEGTVVLITGGLGHVGLILARHLAVHRGCRVVLTSRTPMPPRDRWEQVAAGQPSRVSRLVGSLLEIERLGGRVLPVAADAADTEQMRRAIHHAEAEFGPLGLVVHAAGISDPSGFGPAHQISAAGTDAHFDAKLGGLRGLRAALADRQIPGITLSSLSAVLGGLALGPYSAANAALDACVLADRANGSARWITVDWDTWGQADPALAGEFDMRAEEAVQIFERALAAVDRVDHVVVSTGSLTDRFHQWIVERGLGGVLDETEEVERDPRPDITTAYVEPREGTQAELAEIWGRVLRLQQVGADDDFFRLGGNSVLAIEVVARIRKGLKVPVPTSAVLGYPTVRGLAEQIDELRAAASG